MVFSLGMFHKDNDFKIYYASFFVHFFYDVQFYPNFVNRVIVWCRRRGRRRRRVLGRCSCGR